MHTNTRVGVGVQIAIDFENKLIAEAEVHTKVSDLGLLTETAEAAKGLFPNDRFRYDPVHNHYT